MARPPIKPAIISCAGATFTDDERRLIALENPFGLILFKRSCLSPEQVRALTTEFRQLVERGDAPVLIDQEGGRVARLREPVWREFPPPARYGQLCQSNALAAQTGTEAMLAGLELTQTAGRLMGAQCRALGITVDCAPMIDVPVTDAHAGVIGDRVLASDPARVAALGRAFADGLVEGGVLPVMKHMPGHGRARADSHLELPVVDASRAVLEASDFIPFCDLNLPLAMTAHVLYTALDDKRPATLSPTIIHDIIRGHMKFDGLLMTDAIEMKALKGDLASLTTDALAAGNDVVLYCAGDLAGNTAVLAACPPMADSGLARWARAQSYLPILNAQFDASDYDRLTAAVGELAAKAPKSGESPVMDL